MNSRLYRGTVWHRRETPGYRFQYGVWYLCLDLAEVEMVSRRLKLLSHNRHNLLAFWDRDYQGLSHRGALPPPSDDTGDAAEPQRLELLTVPRLFGHAFNPVSFYFQRREGRVQQVSAEVHNTWHERHVYELDGQTEDGAVYTAQTPKAFYVSPFLPDEAHYRFELRESPEGRLRVRIDEHDPAGERIFASGIDVRPLALSDANLVRLMFSLPLVGFKTVAAIHWQGFKLWRRGVSFRPNPSRASKPKRSRQWPQIH